MNETILVYLSPIDIVTFIAISVMWLTNFWGVKVYV